MKRSGAMPLPWTIEYDCGHMLSDYPMTPKRYDNLRQYRTLYCAICKRFVGYLLRRPINP